MEGGSMGGIRDGGEVNNSALSEDGKVNFKQTHYYFSASYDVYTNCFCVPFNYNAIMA